MVLPAWKRLGSVGSALRRCCALVLVVRLKEGVAGWFGRCGQVFRAGASVSVHGATHWAG
jgi:hypothetical protein